MFSFEEILWIFAALGLIFVTQVDGKKCMRNDDIGWREGNIYYCDNPDLPECCEIDREFTCCERPNTRFLREQLQLWGAVAIFLLGLGIVYLYYFRRDCGCCSSDSLSESFRSFRGKFTSRRGFHSMNEQYKDTSGSTPGICSNNANWQFRKTAL